MVKMLTAEDIMCPCLSCLLQSVVMCGNRMWSVDGDYDSPQGCHTRQSMVIVVMLSISCVMCRRALNGADYVVTVSSVFVVSAFLFSFSFRPKIL
ncbi:transmembrane protein, putative [Bodo saltans]|uniref:Transmembrane protein, putative n=1 Tax=Bodo saltans TaxID=75058 RepID=A0A0S4IQC9_BODSA|nr:transmembrane protein, putative [Bodo saltans]|eukprot:CUF15281.1 transmembrane protein, putative [Bodo saltans]